MGVPSYWLVIEKDNVAGFHACNNNPQAFFGIITLLATWREGMGVDVVETFDEWPCGSSRLQQLGMLALKLAMLHDIRGRRTLMFGPSPKSTADQPNSTLLLTSDVSKVHLLS
jgi:hypothetical protein